LNLIILANQDKYKLLVINISKYTQNIEH